MRKLLMAATAIIGATMGMANVASAQVTPPPSPYASIPPSQTYEPGTVQVRLGVRLWFDAFAGTDSGQTYTTPSGVTTKSQPYMFSSYVRIYPGFDGQTANGIKYGASLEIRQNGGGTGGSGTQTLFWRRQTGYVALDRIGMLRFGNTDQAISLMEVGTFENFDQNGSWDGDLPSFFTPAATLNWVFIENGPWYTTTKMVYLSPRWAGFDFGASFEPSPTGGNDSNCSSGNAVNASCATLSSISSVPGNTFTFGGLNPSLQRRRNMYDVSARYTGSFSGVDLVVQGGYVGSGRVNSGGNTEEADAITYKNLSLLQASTVVNFKGLSVGGNVVGGQTNGLGSGSALLASGQNNEIAFVTGASYTTGPYIVGVQFSNMLYAANYGGLVPPKGFATVGMTHDIGLGVGGSYNWAPGASLYVDFLWGQRHAANYNFYTATPNLADHAGLGNNTRASGINIGNIFRW